METEMRLILGDCIEKMKELPSESIDCIITDPPYGLDKDFGNNLVDVFDYERLCCSCHSKKDGKIKNITGGDV